LLALASLTRRLLIMPLDALKITKLIKEWNNKIRCEMSLQGILSILTIFATCNATILRGTIVKMTCSCIFYYKLVFNCICNYNLWLLLIWMKRKMKSVVVSSMTNGIQQKMKM
jgi:hypothetical protein